MIFDPTVVGSQVGYGKTAAVLALIALTRSDAAPAPPLPTRMALQKTKRIPSQATLVMLPPNLQLAQEKKGPLDVLWWVISYELTDIF